MSILRFIPELPLLRRELIELSNRRRTYVVRFLGAIVILTIVMIAFYRQISLFSMSRQSSFPGMAWSPVRFDGIGGDIFRVIVPMLFHSVQLLMPGLICGAITLEKERNTLGTLFVTRLSPMTIVLEKLGSRLVPMFTFLLLTFPVLAFLYSLGGVDTTLLLSTLWLLICECVFYASIGLLCSSWFATTATAFIWAYVLTGLLLVGSTVLRLGASIPVVTPYSVWLCAFGQVDYGYMSNRSWISEWLTTTMNQAAGSGGITVLARVFVVMAASVPSLMFAGLLLLLARVFLIRRAFISSSSVLLRVFKKVDAFFTRLNDHTTGGVVLIRDHDSLPLFDPVAWRERAKKSLGKARYLFRILVVLEGPVLFICLGAASFSPSTDFSGLRSLLYVIWGIATMILAMKASTMISSERTRETLDALLSTPLTTKEIIEQKIVGMRRLMLVLAIPILSIHLTLLLMHFDMRQVLLQPSWSDTLTVVFYAVMSVVTTFTLMHLIAWVSTLMGLKPTTQARSVTAAMTLIAMWLAISVFLFSPRGVAYQSMRFEDRERFEENQALIATVACCLRPDGSIQANEGILIAASGARVNELEAFYGFSRSTGAAIMASLIVFTSQLLLTFLIRLVTLRRAPGLLGRRDNATVLASETQRLHSSVNVASERV